VFDRLLSSVKVEARSLATTLICAVVAGMSGVVAILFIGIAIFIWAADRYGSLQACLALAGFFLTVGLIALAALFYARSEAAKRAAKRAEEERRQRDEEVRNAPPIWADPSLLPKLLPMLLPIALKAGQIVLKHRGLLLALVSSAAVGWAMLREKKNAPDDDMPAAEQQPAE
jgi:H+/gluconate symporter-like permease